MEKLGRDYLVQGAPINKYAMLLFTGEIIQLALLPMIPN